MVRVPAPSNLQAAGAAGDTENADDWAEDAEDEPAEGQGSTLPSSAENADEQAGPSPRTLQQVSCHPASAGSPPELHSPTELLWQALYALSRHLRLGCACRLRNSSIPAKLEPCSSPSYCTATV